MSSLIAAMSFFLGIHLLVAGTRLRDRLVGWIGEGAYQGVFSLASLAGLIWVIRAYSGAPYLELWGQVSALRWPALVVTAVAFLLVVIGLLTPSPTSAGFEKRLEQENAVNGILRITRHPFLWGVALWSGTHLILNGDAAAAVLFGGFLVLSLAGPPSIDAKRARRYGESWQRFADQTSNLPFAAIAAGRNRLVWSELGVPRILAGLIAWFAVLMVHLWAFGRSPLPV